MVSPEFECLDIVEDAMRAVAEMEEGDRKREILLNLIRVYRGGKP